MDTILGKEREKKGLNKIMLAALIVGAVVVGLGIFGIWKFQSSVQEQKKQALVGALREGSPEFDVMTRRIIVEKDPDNTWESPLGLGTIMMSIAGRIKNNSDKTLTGLEIRVSVLDSFDKVVKETTETIVPEKIEKLPPRQQIDVAVRIEGFKPEDERARVQWKVTAIKTE